MNGFHVLLILGVVGVVALILLAKYGSKWGVSTANEAKVSKADAWMDQSAFTAGLLIPYGIAKLRADSVILDLLAKCRVQAATWDDPPPVVTPAQDSVVVAASTVSALEARVVALEQKGVTSEIPAANKTAS